MFLAIIFPLFNGLDDLAEELYGIGMAACLLHQKGGRSTESWDLHCPYNNMP
jgi:hypothetical protein